MNSAKPSIGAIRYLNALPLVNGLDSDPQVGEVCYEIPSLLAQGLHAGRFDLALVPQVEVLGAPEYDVVPEICVACAGPVESILLFTDRDWSEIRRVAVDVSSRSSVEMLKVLFQQRTGSVPLCVPAAPNLDPLRSGFDAVLLIGDRALAEDRGDVPRYDLGQIWWEETGLPFVFAVWAGRRPLAAEAVAAVQRAAQRGVSRHDELAAAFSREHPDVAGPQQAARYLSDVIHYTLGDAEEASLRHFAELRVAAGLALPTSEPLLRFAGSTPADLGAPATDAIGAKDE
ncbi:MAG: menaquinone biosynthesis protein [Planctomycetota bacterium]